MTFSNDWDDLLKEEMEKPYYKDLRRLLIEEYKTQTIYPEAEVIFRAMRLTSFHDTKVLLLGQDPYHGPGQAQGMSFSVPADFPPAALSRQHLQRIKRRSGHYPRKRRFNFLGERRSAPFKHHPHRAAVSAHEPRKNRLGNLYGQSRVSFGRA